MSTSRLNRLFRHACLGLILGAVLTAAVSVFSVYQTQHEEQKYYFAFKDRQPDSDYLYITVSLTRWSTSTGIYRIDGDNTPISASHLSYLLRSQLAQRDDKPRDLSLPPFWSRGFSNPEYTDAEGNWGESIFGWPIRTLRWKSPIACFSTPEVSMVLSKWSGYPRWQIIYSGAGFSTFVFALPSTLLLALNHKLRDRAVRNKRRKLGQCVNCGHRLTDAADKSACKICVPE